MDAIRQSMSYVAKKEDGRGCSIKFDNLTPEELEKIQYALSSSCGWIRFNEGRLEVLERYDTAPIQEADPLMAGFWTPKPPVKAIEFPKPPFAPKVFEFDEVGDYSFPGILVQHLCGYNWTPDNYQAQVKKMESWGFACLRSKRGGEGKYWEAWFLPSLYQACGALGDTMNAHLACSNCGSCNIDRYDYREGEIKAGAEIRCHDCFELRTYARAVPEAKDGKGKLKRAVDFMQRHASFGTLDVVCQRLAMAVD